MGSRLDLSNVGVLTRAIARGDADAFATLYRARFDYVYALVRRATGLPEQDCLDIAQEAFVRMIRRMKTIDDAAVLDGWIARVARTSAYDHLRKERRRRRREAGAARGEQAPEARELDERIAKLHAAMRGLDESQADLLHLRYGRGMTLEAIGRAVGLKPGATHGRIERALRTAERTGSEPHE